MALHQVADLADVRVDILHLGDLDDLVDRLLDGRPGVVGHFLGVDQVAVERQVGDQVERRFLAVDVDVVVDLVGHLGHLGAGGDALVADQQLGAVDVDDLEHPRRGAAEEALGDRAQDRLVGGLQGVLAGLIDIEHRSARLQHAEVVAFHGQQRAGDDAFVDDLHGQALGAQHVGAVPLQRGDDLPCDRHILISP